MSELVLSQVFLFLVYGTAGCGFGLLFHLFALLSYCFRKMRWLTVLCDILFWLLFTIVVYVMNYNLTYGEIQVFTLCAMGLGATVVGVPVKHARRFFSKGHKNH